MTQKYVNIALTGALRSGKDVFAAYLVRKYGYTRFAFGDGLKDVCRRLYPEQFEGGRKPRALLQNFGQMARSFGDGNVWVNDCFRRIEEERSYYAAFPWMYEGAPLRVVITDARQPNEFSRCRAEGYTIIRVNAPLETRLERARAAGDTFDDADLAHETESHVDMFSVDYDVFNIGTIDELFAQIDAIIASITEVDG